MREEIHCTAFEGDQQIASGSLVAVALAVKEVVGGGGLGAVLVFDDGSSRVIDLDLRGSAEDVAERLTAESCSSAAVEKESKPQRGPGRPKLGVVGREVTLLPRHWEWLGSQPGSASVTLRKLVDQARRANAKSDRQRQVRESTYRFMAAMAGDQPGFEEAIRALFADDEKKFHQQTEAWPVDVRDHTRRLASAAD